MSSSSSSSSSRNTMHQNQKSQEETVSGDRSICRVCRHAATKKCLACKSIKYCSVICQRKDWPRHQEECKVVSGTRAGNYTSETSNADWQGLSSTERENVRAFVLGVADTIHVAVRRLDRVLADIASKRSQLAGVQRDRIKMLENVAAGLRNRPCPIRMALPPGKCGHIMECDDGTIDELSIREFIISGLCRSCQNTAFDAERVDPLDVPRYAGPVNRYLDHVLAKANALGSIPQIIQQAHPSAREGLHYMFMGLSNSDTAMPMWSDCTLFKQSGLPLEVVVKCQTFKVSGRGGGSVAMWTSLDGSDKTEVPITSILLLLAEGTFQVAAGMSPWQMQGTISLRLVMPLGQCTNWDRVLLLTRPLGLRWENIALSDEMTDEQLNARSTPPALEDTLWLDMLGSLIGVRASATQRLVTGVPK